MISEFYFKFKNDFFIFIPYRYIRYGYACIALKTEKIYDLANRLRNDDIKAFNILYWKFHNAVYANAFRLIKEKAVAEDIVQDVFVLLWEKRHTINPDQDIAGWLFVVCYHKTIDQLKQKFKYILADQILQAVVEEPDVFKKDVTEEQLDAVQKAVDQLSPQKKKVFELCKVQRRTYEKAAEELQISKYTVKEYLSEAILNIKKYIGQQATHSGMIIFFFILSENLIR